MPDCKSCKDARRVVEHVPYIIHEGNMARMERTIKRLWILCIVLVAVIVGTNAAWLWHESQYVDEVTTIEAEQTSESGSNYAVGGDLIGNAES